MLTFCFLKVAYISHSQKHFGIGWKYRSPVDGTLRIHLALFVALCNGKYGRASNMTNASFLDIRKHAFLPNKNSISCHLRTAVLTLYERLFLHHKKHSSWIFSLVTVNKSEMRPYR